MSAVPLSTGDGRTQSALLIDAIVQATPEIVDEDLGSLREELRRLVKFCCSVLHGNRGRAGQRLYLDAQTIPNVLAAVHERLMGRRYEVACSTIRGHAAKRANAIPAISERMAFQMFLGPALLWNVADQRRTPLDVEAVADSVVAGLKLPGLELGEAHVRGLR